MKKIILLVYSVFLSFHLYAQEGVIDVSITKSDVFKERKESYINTIIKDKSGKLYVVRSLESGKSLLLNVFDENFKLLQSYEHKLKRRHRVTGTFLDGEHFGFIEYFRNKKEKKVEANLYLSSKEKLEFTKMKIFEIDSDSYPSFFKSLFSSSRIDDNFRGNFSSSDSNSHFVFNIDSDSKKNESHKILVFNNQFEKLWDKEFELPYQDKRFDLQDVIVSDDGIVYVLGKVFPKNGGGNYHYELFKLTKDNTTSVKLEIGDHFLASLELFITPEDRLNCIGFYSEVSDFRFKGVCSFFVNSTTLEKEGVNYSPFTEQFMIDKYGKSKDRELGNIHFKNISYSDDGGTIVTAEEFFITTSFVQNQYGGFQRTFYNFDDIITLKLDIDGKLLWARNINKAQTSENYSDPLMSFGTAQYMNNEYLILNAHKKMGELSGGRIKFRESFLWKASKRNTNLYLVKLKPDGEYTYSTLLKNKDEVTVFNCRYAEQVSDNELILYGQRRRKSQFLKITINK
ncbi:hypothetical protein [Tenacibaculum sp. 190524A05c]|uniref:hypothetical protein n=1 Tax=Tenacibaculum platacis TaxID=3137852 RepID=UPI0032B17B33